MGARNKMAKGKWLRRERWRVRRRWIWWRMEKRMWREEKRWRGRGLSPRTWTLRVPDHTDIAIYVPVSLTEVDYRRRETGCDGIGKAYHP